MWSLKGVLGRLRPRNDAAPDKVPDEVRDTVAGEPPALPPGSTPLPQRSTRNFLAPADLEVTDVGPRNVLLIGACFLLDWSDVLEKLGYDELSIDRILFYYLVRLPASPPKPIETYDAQLVQIPLPSIMPEQEYLRLPADDPRPYEELLDSCVGRLDLFLEEALAWSDRVPAFVMNYLSPQQNLLGRLLPRYDIRNPIHFIERLNQELDGLLKKHRNAYLIDANHIASVYGRRFVQEDAFWHQHHGGLMSFADEKWDKDERLQQSAPVAQVHGAAVDGYVEMVWQEVRAAYRTLRRADEVKLLCVDLDDTLWRGVIADWDQGFRGWKIAGWPLGLVEILQYLKRRGIILAIVSKNDETHIRSVFQKIFEEGEIRLEDFAILKINWHPKAQNIAEVMAEANILPKSVVFLDDNPVERAAVKAAFPEIRTLETSHLRWSRVLGWSPELQVAAISGESARKTELIQAQVERQKVRAVLSREEFLSSLNLRMSVHSLCAVADSRFARAFELINKTNQFNTTGVRWLEKDAASFFKRGGLWWTFELTDRFTSYGLVGVVCVEGVQINQFVMSCRVAGLEAEFAALAVILGRTAPEETQFEGVVKETKNNALSRDLFARMGWAEVDGRWRGQAPRALPVHVTLLESAAPS